MNIDELRKIPLADFLARLGHEPVRRSGNELWYLAPYRGERTPSFRVNVDENGNKRYDFQFENKRGYKVTIGSISSAWKTISLSNLASGSLYS